MQKKILSISSIVVMLTSVMIGLSGCGGTCSTSNSPEVSQAAITIDNAGMIPVFGNSSTSTVVYVHNNSQVNVSGINYNFVSDSSAVNTTKNSKLLSMLNKSKAVVGVSNDQCRNIPAGQSCPLQITTPILSGTNTQGSMSIQASYEINNKPYTFNQIINYAQVQNNQQTAGAKFQTGVNISGYGHPTGYATVYLYGSGQNQIYNVSSITIDKPAVTIVNGNISGRQIQSNFVQAVEISSPTLSSSISATITVNSEVATSGIIQNNKSLNVEGSSQFINSVDISIYPNSVGAILTTGLVPLINTLNGASGTMLVQNTGDQEAIIGNISAGSGITNLSGCSGSKLASGAICTIGFTVTGTDGSTNITVPYTGGTASSVSGNVTWFDGDGAALVSMFTSSNPLSFVSTTSGQATITVTNVGGYTLNNISVPEPTIISGSATATISNNNCSNQTLISGASCSYNVNVSDQTTDLNRQISLGFNATYTTAVGVQNYTQSMILNYNSTVYGAILAISPSNMSLAISGNTLESNTQILAISNNGNTTADISTTFNSNQAFLTESATTCGATLNAGESCTSTIQFGPTFSRVESSGIATYVVNYTASGQVPAGSVTSNISWMVQGYDQSISLFNQFATGAESGDGSLGNPYIFNMTRQSAGNQFVTLIYKNTGTHAMMLKGIQDMNSGIVWNLDYNKTTCNSESSVLAPNQTCDIVYKNVIESNILAAGTSIGGAFSSFFILPRLVYQDVDNGVQFDWIPNPFNFYPIIQTQFNIATVANSIMLNESGTNTETVTVSHLLANIDGPLNVTVISQMEDYFDSPAKENSVGCSSNSANGIMTQTCIMDKDNLSTSTIYQVNQAYLTESQDLYLNTLFSMSPLSQLAVMTPLSGSLSLGTSPSTYAYITSGSSVAMFKQNPSNGMLLPLNPATVPTIQTTYGIAVDTIGKHVYVSRSSDPSYNVLMYSISESGVLLPLLPESVGNPASGTATEVVYSQLGYVYTASQVGALSMYGQDLLGVLTPLTPSDINIGGGCLGLTVDMLGQYLYSTCQSGTLNSFKIESSGQLTNATNISSLANTPKYVAVTPNGNYVYATTAESIVMYSSSFGVLTPLSPESTIDLNTSASNDHYIAIHPTGKFAYVVNSALNNVSMYSINALTGALTALSPATVATETGPQSITFDPSGKYAYVANSSANTVGIYTVNPSTGVLNLINTINVNSPNRIAFN